MVSFTTAVSVLANLALFFGHVHSYQQRFDHHHSFAASGRFVAVARSRAPPSVSTPRIAVAHGAGVAVIFSSLDDDFVSSKPVVYVTDEELEGWLEDMVYSGDMSGYVKKNVKNVITDDFAEFVQEKIDASDDEDEIGVLKEVLSLVNDKLKLTDGLTNSDEVYEKRLDRILFTPPNQRMKWLEDNKEEISGGFIDYIQTEMKTSTDSDSKVVLASILQLVGQTTGKELLEADVTKELLRSADTSLGEQFKKEVKTIDGSFRDKNEQILAGLMFSKNDILEDVLNNLHVLDEEFLSFLQNKVDVTRDMEERVGLQSLLETVTTVLERVKEVQGDNELAGQTSQDEDLTMDQVKKRMQEVQTGTEVANTEKGYSPGVFTVKEDKKDSFQSILERFQNLPADVTLRMAVEKNYELCDYEFMDMLRKEVTICNAEGAEVEATLYQEVLDMINEVMASKIGTAQDRLMLILSKKALPAMESEIVAMVRRNEVDEALVLLLEANIQQAEAAGSKQAADLLKKLNERILREKERNLPDEQRLLRALLRQVDSEKRKELLYAGFKPQKSMSGDGNTVEGAPLISPPMFIQVVKQFIMNFGNVEFGLMEKAQAIIDEAQVVATELYGEGMSPREQQKLMFEKNTVSVWDLAEYEWKSVAEGNEDNIPWRNDAFDEKNPEDILHDRVKKVGGSDDGGDGKFV